MPRSHSFTIFLLKEGHDNKNSLIEGHGLEHITDASSIPEGAYLFIGDSPPKPPWWKNYFGIRQNLFQYLKSALLFIKHDERHFVLSFGHAYSKLADNAYEYDFGLRVTLNSIEPDKLNSIDTVEPNNGRRRRTQIPNASDITLFDFDRDSSILRNISGHVKEEYKETFKSPTGASNLRINSKVAAEEIQNLLSNLFEIYNAETYKETFPNLLNITPVKDPEKIQALDNKLLKALRQKSEHLYLTIPEIIDYQQFSHFHFKPRKKSAHFDDIYLEHYYEYLKQIGIDESDIQLDDVKKHKIDLVQQDTAITTKSYHLYKCLVFDTKLEDDDSAFHLNEGNWYKVNDDYLTELENFLDPLCRTTNLPDYTHSNEAEYNNAVPSQNPDIICLDTKNIAPSGQTQIEPCDLFTVKDNEGLFIHVKRSTKSASISHLLNQGQNSAQAIRMLDDSLTKLHKLLESSSKGKFPSKRVDRFKVCFAIVTHKDMAKKSKNLPLFSRISAVRTMKYLESINIEAWYEFIKDKTES